MVSGVWWRDVPLIFACDFSLLSWWIHLLLGAFSDPNQWLQLWMETGKPLVALCEETEGHCKSSMGEKVPTLEL